MSEHSNRSTFLVLKHAIEALAAMPENGFRPTVVSFGKQLAFLPLESWPPSYFYRAWHMLLEHTEALGNLGINSQELPEPPRFPGRDRYISRHPEEGFLLVFPKEANEVREALRLLPAEYRSDPAPHWIVYPVQGTGRALLSLAHHHHFELDPGIPEYALDCDLHPLPLLSRNITLSLGPEEEIEGFDIYFPKAAQVLEQVKEEIPDRSFHDAPKPHWQTPATPYAAQALLQIALQHQFSINPTAVPLLLHLDEEAQNLPPRPPVRRIEYDASAKRFWLYFPWQETTLREVRDGIAGSKFEKHSHPRWGIPATNAKGLRELEAFLERHPEFSSPPEVRAPLKHLLLQAEQRVKDSKAQEADITITGLGGELRPFQKACIRYALDANYRLLIGDDVGLGKTPEALAILLHAKAFPALIIVPAHLKYNWKRETEHWLPGCSIRVLDGEESLPDDYEADITIVNYDILTPRLSAMQRAFQRRGGVKGIVADESHYIKEEGAQRTKAALALAEGIPVRLALSGTALPNRPIELVSQLTFLDQLSNFGSFWGFVRRYCHARLTDHGWDFNGNSNELELHEQLRAVCYIRRMRDDVLPELPPIHRHLVPVEIDNREEYEHAERALIAWLREQVQQDTQFLSTLGSLNEEERNRAISRRADSIEQRARRAEELRRIEILKQLAARGKMHAVRPFIEGILAQGEKLVVYASHIEIQHQLVEWFPDAAVVLGETSAKKRDSNSRRFQEDPNCNLIICSLQAAKEGLTLTAASKIVMTELGWNPLSLEQPEGRIRRMTQKAETLAAYYLLATQTIEPEILRLIEEKQQVIAAISDGRKPMKNESVLGSLLKHLVHEGA